MINLTPKGAISTGVGGGSVDIATQSEVNTGSNETKSVSPKTFANATKWQTKANLVGGKVPSAELPSYVSEVLEFADFASFPITGAGETIYISTDNDYQYRWSGTVYIQITNGFIATTDDVPEGGNRYFSEDRAIHSILTGLSFASGLAVTIADTILVAIGKLQKQITNTNTVLVAKQDTLVSGTNVKTVDGNSILGSGNLKLQAYSNTEKATHTGDLLTTIVNSFEIPANAYKAGDIIEIGLMCGKNGGATADTWEVVVNGLVVISETIPGANRCMRLTVQGIINAASGANNLSIWRSNQSKLSVSNATIGGFTMDFTVSLTVETRVTLGDAGFIATHYYTYVNKL